MCKFINGLSEIFRWLRARWEAALYVVEDKEFRNTAFTGVGLQIALLHCQPVLQRIPKGKE